MSMKKFRKTTMTSELSTLKLGYMPIFVKIWEMFFWLIVEWLLNNQGKNEVKNISERKYNF